MGGASLSAQNSQGSLFETMAREARELAKETSKAAVEASRTALEATKPAREAGKKSLLKVRFNALLFISNKRKKNNLLLLFLPLNPLSNFDVKFDFRFLL